MRTKQLPRTVQMQDGMGFGWRHVTVEEINGNLAYVRDEETGEADWRAPHEWQEDR
jgi:hypothetical protein